MLGQRGRNLKSWRAGATPTTCPTCPPCLHLFNCLAVGFAAKCHTFASMTCSGRSVVPVWRPSLTPLLPSLRAVTPSGTSSQQPSGEGGVAARTRAKIVSFVR